MTWRDRLLTPSASVVDEDSLRRARYTMVSIAVVTLVAAFVLVVAFVLYDDDLAFKIISVATVVILVALWPLARGRRHGLAAGLALTVTGGAVVASWLTSGAGTAEADILYFLAVPIWMSSVLLPSRHAALVAAGSVLVTSLLLGRALIARDVGWESLLPVPILLALAGGLATNSARLREHDLRRADALAEELREQERTRLQMLNTIAHDLASPLTPLKLQLKLIPKDKPLPPERLAVIERNVAQMQRLVTDVKELARLDAGALSIRRGKVDLSEIAAFATDAFREEAAARGIRLESQLAPSVPLEADPERLTQVVYNLVTNALKFTPPGGTVLVATERSEGAAILAVKDTGRGLTPEEIGRLFRAFSQVHERSEVKERGTGLGLYISRGIARAHDGELEVTSEGRGRGSTFTLSLPAANRHDGSAP